MTLSEDVRDLIQGHMDDIHTQFSGSKDNLDELRELEEKIEELIDELDEIYDDLRGHRSTAYSLRDHIALSITIKDRDE